jgi:hypothetical protein
MHLLFTSSNLLLITLHIETFSYKTLTPLVELNTCQEQT